MEIEREPDGRLTVTCVCGHRGVVAAELAAAAELECTACGRLRVSMVAAPPSLTMVT